MENRHFITATYRGPTSAGPSCVILRSQRFSQSVSIPYNHALRDTADIAETWLRANGYTIESCCELAKGYGFMVREFIGLREAKRGERWQYAPTSPLFDPVECLREMITLVVTTRHPDANIANPWCRPSVLNAARALRKADGLNPFENGMDIRYTEPAYMSKRGR